MTTPPYLSSIYYDRVDGSTLLISTLNYSLSNPLPLSVRLIVVSKEDNLEATKYTQIEHYTDLSMAQTTYVLNLQPKYYKFIIEETFSDSENCIQSTPIDLTNLQARPTAVVSGTFRNSVVLTTNIDSTSSIFVRDGVVNENVTFVVDAFDVSGGCSELISIPIESTDIDTSDNNMYVLHLRGVTANTEYLIVYHVEYLYQGISIVTKDSAEVTATTTNDAAVISNFSIEYDPSYSYPVTNTTSPTGFKLSWTSTEGTLFDPQLGGSEYNTYYKIERAVQGGTYTGDPIMIDVSDTGLGVQTYTDSSSLIAGTIYKYRIFAGIHTISTNLTEYNEDSTEIDAPYYTIPNALVVSIANTNTCSTTDHSATPHIFDDGTGVTITWTALTSTDLHGYIISDNDIQIEDSALLGTYIPVANSTESYTFTSLTPGEVYTKNFTFDISNSNWHDLSQNASYPYPSVTTTQSFIPYGPLVAPVLPTPSVVFNPVYVNYDVSSTGIFSWNAVTGSGLDSDVTYHVYIYRTDASNAESYTDTTTSLSYSFTVTNGYDYTFEVYAKQTEPGCNTSVQSTAASTTEKAEHLSSEVRDLSGGYVYRIEYSTTELGANDPLVPFETSIDVLDINVIHGSAVKPLKPSWDIESEYILDVSFNGVVYADPTNPIQVGLDSDTESTAGSIFNTSNPREIDTSVFGLVDSTTYTFRVTPYSLTDPSFAGTTGSFNFIHYEIPAVTNVNLAVNTDASMTISWDSDICGNMYYDLYLADTSNNTPVFQGRVSGSTRSYVITRNNGKQILVDNLNYIAYVRPWREINDSYAYINNIVSSEETLYFNPPSVSIPSYTDILVRNILSGDINAFLDLSANTTYNGVTDLSYNLKYQSYTSVINDYVITDNVTWTDFDLSGTSPVTADASVDYAALPLTRVGYYKFKIYIISYKNPNTNEIITTSEISSNESDLFVMSTPYINSVAINDVSLNDASGTYTSAVPIYNNWSVVTDGLCVIIPNNESEFTYTDNDTLEMYVPSSSINNGKIINSRAVRLTYYIGNGIVDTATFTYYGFTSTFTPISKRFIVASNSVGLTYYSTA